jgi:hypothetical protein
LTTVSPVALALIFKTKPCLCFAAHEGLSDADLCDAVRRAQSGLVDADLGGGVIKQRLARPRRGRSSGFRSIVFFRKGDKAVFVYGFAKNDRSIIRRDELKAFRKLADHLLNYDDAALQAAVKNGTLIKVAYDE